MKFRYTTYLLWTLLLGSIAFAHPAFAQRLGLHVTQEELNIWKQRASNGPYRVTGDVQLIRREIGPAFRTMRRHFLRTPRRSVGRVSPPEVAGVGSLIHRLFPLGGPRGNLLEMPRLFILLPAIRAYRDAVLNELLAQAATAGTNWTDPVRWSHQYVVLLVTAGRGKSPYG